MIKKYVLPPICVKAK